MNTEFCSQNEFTDPLNLRNIWDIRLTGSISSYVQILISQLVLLVQSVEFHSKIKGLLYSTATKYQNLKSLGIKCSNFPLLLTCPFWFSEQTSFICNKSSLITSLNDETPPCFSR